MGGLIADDGGTILYEFSDGLPKHPKNSCNMAEYMAFMILCDKLHELVKKEDEIIIFGDSKLVIKQMIGEWKIKKGAYIEHAKKSKIVFDKLLARVRVRLAWIPREENVRADELSKIGLR